MRIEPRIGPMHGVHPAPKATPHEHRAEIAKRFVREIDTLVLSQQAEVEDAEQVEAEDDDERTTEPGDPDAGDEEHAPEYTCGSAERDEYEGEAEDEEERMNERRAPRCAHFFETQSGDKCDVARNER